MKKNLAKVQEFHERFGIGVGCDFREKLPEEIVRLRYRLMEEENSEYLEAALNGEFVEVADALGDKLYVLLGTIIAHGMQEIIQDVFDEIHSSNMSKLGEDGKPIYRSDGKAMKGPNFRKPDLKNILEKK
jgi:predicted HAD superfamily Cof-like phosphohydrolase